MTYSLCLIGQKSLTHLAPQTSARFNKILAAHDDKIESSSFCPRHIKLSFGTSTNFAEQGTVDRWYLVTK